MLVLYNGHLLILPYGHTHQGGRRPNRNLVPVRSFYTTAASATHLAFAAIGPPLRPPPKRGHLCDRFTPGQSRARSGPPPSSPCHLPWNHRRRHRARRCARRPNSISHEPVRRCGNMWWVGQGRGDASASDCVAVRGRGLPCCPAPVVIPCRPDDTPQRRMAAHGSGDTSDGRIRHGAYTDIRPGLATGADRST